MKYPFWYPRYLNNGGISICVWCIHLYYQYINIYMSDVYIMAAKDSPFPGGCCCEVMFGGTCYFPNYQENHWQFILHWQYPSKMSSQVLRFSA